jgi:hypothetical protein
MRLLVYFVCIAVAVTSCKRSDMRAGAVIEGDYDGANQPLEGDNMVFVRTEPAGDGLCFVDVHRLARRGDEDEYRIVYERKWTDDAGVTWYAGRDCAAFKEECRIHPSHVCQE